MSDELVPLEWPVSDARALAGVERALNDAIHAMEDQWASPRTRGFVTQRLVAEMLRDIRAELGVSREADWPR